MGIFDKLKSKNVNEDNSGDSDYNLDYNVDENVDIEEKDNSDDILREHETSNKDFSLDTDNIIHESLAQEIVEAVGQGSEDVKKIVVTLKNGDIVTFIVAGGRIKKIDSPESNFAISNRLIWVDQNKFSPETINKVEDIFDGDNKKDYFEALVEVAYIENVNEDETPTDLGLELAGIISDTHAERSIKSLIYAHDKEIATIQTDWFFGQDTDVIEAYTGFNLEPEAIDFTVKDVTNNIEQLLSQFEDGRETILYANPNTDYENTDTDISRYVLGAIQSSYDYQTGENGVPLNDLMQYSDGFSIPDVLKEVQRMLEQERISDFDPYIVEEEPEVEEIEEIEEELEPEIEEEEFEEPEVEEEPIVEEEILDVPYPEMLPGGTKELGGALLLYIDRLLKQENFSDEVSNYIQYKAEYNSLLEQGVQNAERAMLPIITGIELSVHTYEEFADIDNENKTNFTSSNIHRALYYLESERNDLNESRTDTLIDLYEILEDNIENSPELLKLIEDVIKLKIYGIDEVENVVLGIETEPQQQEEKTFNKETIPLFYTILQELGVDA